MPLQAEKEKLNKLRIEDEKAQAEYHRQLERDAVREDGSPRQDALHERFLKEARDNAKKTHAAVIAQEKVVAVLLESENT